VPAANTKPAIVIVDTHLMAALPAAVHRANIMALAKPCRSKAGLWKRKNTKCWPPPASSKMRLAEAGMDNCDEEVAYSGHRKRRRGARPINTREELESRRERPGGASMFQVMSAHEAPSW
jgi:hypothetical protein